METCIFCKIAKKEIPKEFVYEDAKVKAFDDINPKAPVHILVIPEEHIQSIAELDDTQSEIVSKLIYTAKKIAVQKKLSGYKLIFNVGRDGGQMVDHLHLHLLGGWRSSEEKKIQV